MNDENMFSIKDNNGKEYKAHVIDIFSVVEYPDNDYIMYTFDPKKEGDIKVYISKIVVNEDNNVDLLSIDDEEELKAVNLAIDENIAKVGGARNV